MIRNICKPFGTIVKQSKLSHLSQINIISNQNLSTKALNLSNQPITGFYIKNLCQNFGSEKRTDNFKKKMTKQEMFKAQEEQLMKQAPDDDPNSYDKPSGWGGKIFMGIGVLGLMGIVAYAEGKRKKEQSDMDQSISGMVQVKDQKKVKVGGEWTLINHKGQTISSSDLSGSYYLIYFGFTKCPDVCPATLIKLGRVLKLIRKMPEYHYLDLKCIFVSCDPDRDTPKRLQEYLKHFDDDIIGVTGASNEDPELINCMKSFKIYANKIPMQNGNYSMDHTTITYLMDDQNQYVDHLNPTLTEQQMAKAVVNRVLDHDFHKMRRRNQKGGENQIS